MIRLPQKLERHNIFVKVIRIITVPLLNLLPSRFIKLFMNKSSKDASTVVAKGGSTHALEAMYNRYHRTLFSRGILQGCSDILWHHIVSQPKALRNRLKIVKDVLYKKVTYMFDVCGYCDISILSIAGGSSRSIIYMIQDLNKNKGIDNKIHVITVDKDQAALDVGKGVAKELKLQDHFEWLCGNAYDIDKHFSNRRFDIVEIVGLLDYFDFNRSVKLLRLSHQLMNDKGFIIIANVMPNSEIPFVHKTGWPSMYYRSMKDIELLLNSSNFNNSDIIIEPMKIHCIGVGQK